jgi:hypothetical protein
MLIVEEVRRNVRSVQAYSHPISPRSLKHPSYPGLYLPFDPPLLYMMSHPPQPLWWLHWGLQLTGFASPKYIHKRPKHILLWSHTLQCFFFCAIFSLLYLPSPDEVAPWPLAQRVFCRWIGWPGTILYCPVPKCMYLHLANKFLLKKSSVWSVTEKKKSLASS